MKLNKHKTLNDLVFALDRYILKMTGTRTPVDYPEPIMPGTHPVHNAVVAVENCCGVWARGRAGLPFVVRPHWQHLLRVCRRHVVSEKPTEDAVESARKLQEWALGELGTAARDPWVVCGPSGQIYVRSIMRTREQSVNSLFPLKSDWARCRAAGWVCRRAGRADLLQTKKNETSFL